MGDVGRDTEKVEWFTPPSRPVPHPLVLNLNITGWPTLAKDPTLHDEKLLALIADIRQAGTHVPPASHKYIYRLQSPHRELFLTIKNLAKVHTGSSRGPMCLVPKTHRKNVWFHFGPLATHFSTLLGKFMSHSCV